MASTASLITTSPTMYPYMKNFDLTTSFAFVTPVLASTLTSTFAPTTFTNRSVVPRVSAEIPIWVIPCYSIILLFAIVGNLLVLLTLVQNRRMRTITNVFLLNLAISDILLGVLCMPVTLVGTLLRHFIFGEFFCKLIQFLQAVSVAVSSWTLVAISCERYYAICHPLRSRTWQTINHANKIIAFIWIGSIICMTPIAIFSQLMPTSRQGLRKCREHWPTGSIGYERAYNIFLDFALLVFPLLVLSFTYILITRTLYVSMCNERAMIFGSSGVGGTGLGCDNVMSGTVNFGNGSYKLNKTTGTQQSFRLHRAHNNEAIIATNSDDLELVYQQQQQQQQHQHHQQIGHQYYHAANGFTHGGSKRKLLTSYDGRRHLYCMRSASVKSLRQTNSKGRNDCYTGGEPSPSPSLTLGNMPQQQRFLLQRHHPQYVEDVESRKSVTTPSLRINTEAALRRSNESKSLESKKRVVKMLFVLVLEFFICWTPLYVINTAAMFLGPAIYEYVDYTSISFLQLLAYSSSCCNPITYCFMNASFRRAFVDTFKGMRFADGGRFFRKRSQNETNLSVAGGSIALANSVMSQHTVLESPRL